MAHFEIRWGRKHIQGNSSGAAVAAVVIILASLYAHAHSLSVIIELVRYFIR